MSLALDKLREWLQREHEQSAAGAEAAKGPGPDMVHLAYLEGHRDGLDYALRALDLAKTQFKDRD